MPTGRFILRCVLDRLYNRSAQFDYKSRDWWANTDALQIVEDAVRALDTEDEVLWAAIKNQEAI